MYQAVVAKVHTRPHPNADKLQLGTVLGYQVIIGKEVNDGDLGIFFEEGGQLSEEFANANDLIRRKNPDGSTTGGMFMENRRVKAIRLRGERSDGFWCPLSYLRYLKAFTYTMKEGDTFDVITVGNQAHPICNKYETRATRATGSHKRLKTRAETPTFQKQFDFEQFKRSLDRLPDSGIAIITEKLHGTSFRYGLVLDDVPIKRGWLSSLAARWFKWPLHNREYVYLNGSKNVILEHAGDSYEGFYDNESFRTAATKNISLYKGEVLYGEIVGYTTTGSPIMAPQRTEILTDKEVAQTYGTKMVYAYGCKEGQHKVYIYRIARYNEDGIATELSWEQVKGRCKELGLEHVPELAARRFYGAYDKSILKIEVPAWTETDEGLPYPSTLDPSHIREGVVLRIESGSTTSFYKNKAFAFGILEGYLKEDEEYVDTEEVS